QPHLLPAALPERLLREATFQDADEVGVDLHDVEEIARPELPQELRGDRPGARADLKHPGRAAPLAELRRQGPGQAAAARQDRSGVPVLPAELAIELAALRQVAHPGASPASD